MKQLELTLNKRLLIVEFPDEKTFNEYLSFYTQNKVGAFEQYIVKFLCKGPDLTEEIAKELVHVNCFVCGGDGKETCTNPDHGFVGFGTPLSFLGANESQCPCCGFDPNHKIPKGGACECCDGVGNIKYSEIENKMDEYGFDEEIPTALESFISSIEAKNHYWGKNPIQKPELYIAPNGDKDYWQLEADKKEYDEAESRTFNIDNVIIFEIL